MKKFNCALVVLVAVGLVLVSYFAGVHNLAQELDKEQDTWTYYQNPAFYFSLEYPSTLNQVDEWPDSVSFLDSATDGGMGSGFTITVNETTAASSEEWLASQSDYRSIATIGTMVLVGRKEILEHDGKTAIYGEVLEGILVKNKHLFKLLYGNQTPIGTLPSLDNNTTRIMESFRVEDPIPTAEEADAHNANTVLAQFLGLLSEGTYEAAAQGYDGDYDQLRQWNPGVDPNDFAQLWKNGCEINGLRCLKVENQSITSHPDADTFIFTVTFLNADGSRFQSHGQSEYSFTVTRAANDLFQVQTMPVYVE